MSKGLVRSLTRGGLFEQKLVKQTAEFEGLAMTVDGATGAGFGQLNLGVLFPRGNILVLGAVALVTFSGPGGHANLSDTWNGDYGVGFTQDGDAFLSGTDVIYTGAAAVGPAVAEVSPRTKAFNVVGAPLILENSGGDADDTWINFTVDDADISADGIEFTVSGEFHIVYTVLGAN